MSTAEALRRLPGGSRLFVRKTGWLDWTAKVVYHSAEGFREYQHGIGFTRWGAIRDVVRKVERSAVEWSEVT